MPRILVADDDRLIRWSLTQVFSGEGYEVVAVDSAAQAMEEITRGRVDVLITDYAFPEFSGLEVLRRAKKFSPKTQVIMITGYCSPHLERLARDIGVFDYFDKPFDVTAVAQSVARALAAPRIGGSPAFPRGGEMEAT